MKVMHVEAGRNLYGGALQVFYLLRHLATRNVDNILVCPQGSAIGRVCREFATIEECKMGGDLDMLFCSRLRKIITRHQPDLIHIHSRRGADIWGGLAARRSHTPALLTRRVDNREAGFLARWKGGLYKKVVAISEGIRQVQLSMGLAARHVVTIHSAVDTDAYHPAPDDDNIRQRFGFNKNHLVVAVIAQLIERKGHRTLLEVIPQILEEQPEARFLILGKGALQTDLQQLSKDKGLDSVVHFAGFQDDIDRIFSSIDLVVHPALMEGLGVSLLQASACGIPIVASKVGGIPEIVIDGENGYLVEAAEPAELKHAIIDLLRDKEKRKAFGARGREIVERDFSIEVMTEKNLQLYQSLLGDVRS